MSVHRIMSCYLSFGGRIVTDVFHLPKVKAQGHEPEVYKGLEVIGGLGE